MESFINHIKAQQKLQENSGVDMSVPYFIRLGQFEKSVEFRRKQIEELMLNGDYDIAKEHLAIIGRKLFYLYKKMEELEKEEKKDCGCIQNITKEEFNIFLKNIGGLENGYGCRYHGKNNVKKIFFNITNWFLWKLPTYHKSKTFSKENSVMIFLYNILYWICKPILKDQKPKNPFRSKIYTAGSFSVGPGWYGLLKTLIESAVNSGWNKEVCQVKEKFGGLRFYINGASTEVHDIISKYESLSCVICEDCGSSGEQRSGGWIRTLCNNCNDKISKE